MEFGMSREEREPGERSEEKLKGENREEVDIYFLTKIRWRV